MTSTVLLFLIVCATVQAEMNEEESFQIPEKNSNKARIVGGEEAVPHSIPFQVAVIIGIGDTKTFCGGVLISNQCVLTAAHCVDGFEGPIKVLAGAHNVEKKETTQKWIDVKEYYVHPKFDKTEITYDAAILILVDEIEFDIYIKPARLPKLDETLDYVNCPATVSGWGVESDLHKTISPVLRKVDLKIIDNKSCQLAHLQKIHESQICAARFLLKSPCYGDSGGPLFVDGDTVVGLVSFGKLLCLIGLPTVYTRITLINPWIREYCDCIE